MPCDGRGRFYSAPKSLLAARRIWSMFGRTRYGRFATPLVPRRDEMLPAEVRRAGTLRVLALLSLKSVPTTFGLTGSPNIGRESIESPLRQEATRSGGGTDGQGTEGDTVCRSLQLRQ